MRRFCALLLIGIPCLMSAQSVSGTAKSKSMVTLGVESLAKKIAVSFSQQAKDRYRNAIAVFPFSASGKKAEENRINEVIASLLAVEIKKTGTFNVIDRENIDKAMKELELSMTGLASRETALEAGRFISANCFLAGSIAEVEGNYIITARLVDVETGAVIVTEKVEFAVSKLNSMATLLFTQRKYPVIAGFQSALVPGWGQFYNDDPVNGTVCLSTFIASALTAAGAAIFAQYSYNEYNNYLTWSAADLAANQAKARDLYAATTAADTVALIGLITYGTVWLYSVTQAVVVAGMISGDIERAQREVAFGVPASGFALYPEFRNGAPAVACSFSFTY
ncbi:MAG: hypothetical protein HZC28_16970 [Spirochaetes bacterium]|nr:hypothetical protein [Spirochaetota bacterium]